MFKNSFVKLLVLSIILLSSSIVVLAYTNEDWGCCLDTDVGCRQVYGESEILACKNAYNYQDKTSCTPSDNPAIAVSDSPICANVGCCCIGNTFKESATKFLCDSLGGSFSFNNNCYDACGINNPLEKSTCDSLSGYWCLPSNSRPVAKPLTNLISDTLGRPTSSHICYDLPCTEESVSCENLGRAEICTNSVDDDGDCLADTADSDCGFSVKGIIVDQNKLPVSNVKIKFTNLNHKQNPDTYDNFVDSFITYSVGSKGEFFFQGFSRGKYEVEIIDSYYKYFNGAKTFVLNEEVYIDIGTIEVIPKNSFSVKGKVSSGTAVVPNTIISLEGTNYYGVSDNEGNYILNFVKIINSNYFYKLLAFKEDYSPYENKFKSVAAGQTITQNINLVSNLCSIRPSTPQIEKGNVLKGFTDIQIFFNSGNCKADEFIIYRCEGANCTDIYGSGFSFVSKVSGVESNYIDRSVNLKWGTDYTYYIMTQTNSQSSSISNLIKINTGNELCKNKNNILSFCMYETKPNIDLDNTKTVVSSKGVICNDQNNLVDVITCAQGSQCVETNSGTDKSSVSCRKKDDCDPVEENYFGLYFNKDSCQGTNNNKFCVYDLSRTNTNFCYSCDAYSSCFNYKSKDSCSQNNCNVGSCEWSVTNAALNTGICYDTYKSKCEDCNTPFNKVFGVCDPLTCSLLGDCSYSGKDGSCKDCEAISCYDYTDKNSCVGSSSSLQLDTKTNLLLKVSYDTCSVNSCKWDSKQNLCYKDRDVNSIDDCSYFSSNRIIISNSGNKPYTEATCKKDILPPITSSYLNVRNVNPTSPVNGKLTATFNAKDTVNSESGYFDVKEIYYCIESENSGVCNDRTKYEKISSVDEKGNKIIVIEKADKNLMVKPMGFTKYYLKSGKNIIKFYSVDYSNNLEEIKSEYFYVDLQKPIVDIKIIQMPKPDIKKTDVSIYASSDEPIYCYMNLDNSADLGNTDKNYFNQNNITEAFLKKTFPLFKTLFSKEFYSLEDGNYILKVVCTDLGGNIYSVEKSFLLDADPRIQSPLPSGATNKNSIELSVKTLANVDCKYTTDINKNFEEISSANKMNIEKTGSLYIHKSLLQLGESKNYIYYVKCNLDPAASEKISFTLDQIAPEVKITTGLNQKLDDIGWLSSAEIILSCEDSPLGGFGCNKTYYCINKLYDVSDASKIVPCNPNIIYEKTLELSEPVTLCYNAQENINKGEGGLKSKSECKNIFVDLDDPQIVIDFLPTSINKNSININGMVYDSFKLFTPSFTINSNFGSFLSKTDYYTSFLNEWFEVKEFDYLTEIDFSSYRNKFLLSGESVSKGKIYVIFNYQSESNFGALTFDVKNNFVSLGIQSGKTFTELVKKQVTSDYFSGIKQIRINNYGNKMSAYIKSDLYEDDFKIETNSQTLKKLYGGKFGYMIEDFSDGNIFYNSINNNVGDLKLYYPGVEPFVSLDKKVYLKVNGKLTKIFNSKNTFNQNLKLFEGIPRHNSIYTVSLIAEDLAGRTSTEISQNIYYDLSGPVTDINSLIFKPLVEQNDNSYIEYGYDSEIFLNVEDDYSGVSKVIVTIRDQKLELTKGSTPNSFFGLFTTSKLPAGKQDMKVESYDGLGNKNIESFTNIVLIEDRIDPAITLNLENNYFNSDKPIISFTTEELAKCSVEYESNEGNLIKKSISTDFTLNHVITVDVSLKSEANNEIETEFLLICSDINGRKVSQIVDIVIDLRKPIYTINTNTNDLYTEKVQRNYELYSGVVSLDKNFKFFSDEPVKCRYSISDTGLKTTYVEMTDSFYSDYKYSLEDESKGHIISNGNRKTFNFICVDRAGNEGNLKTIEIYSDSNKKPVLFDLKKKFFNQDVITFKTIRANVNCEAKIAGVNIDIQSIIDSNNRLFVKHEINTNSFGEGNYLVDISCISSQFGRTDSQVSYVKDTISPLISFNTKFDNENIGEKFIKTNNSYINLNFNSNEFVNLKIISRNILIDNLEGKTFDFNLPLKYGYNYFTLILEDSAKNILVENISILSLSNHPQVSFSNFLGGSIRDNYNGAVLIQGNQNINFLTLKYGKNNNAENSYSIPFVKEYIQSEDLTYFKFNLTNDLLFNMINKNNEYGLLSNLNYIDTEFIFKVVTNFTNYYYQESFYYNPFVESFNLKSPKSNFLSDKEIINQNKFAISGIIEQQNYLLEAEYGYGVESNLIKLKPVISRFNLSIGLNDLNNGNFILQSMNDLGGYFKILSNIFYDSAGPSATISLYPKGTISFSKKPQFKVNFESPGKITAGKIFNENLSKNYSVEILNSDFSFEIKVKTIDPLDFAGTYYLNLDVKDEYNNFEYPQFKFIYSEAPFNLYLVEPLNGVSSKTPFTLSFQADRPSECRYSFNKSSFETSNYILGLISETELHSFEITIPDKGTKIVYIICKDFEGTTSKYFEFNISVDETPPIIKKIDFLNTIKINEKDFLVEYPLTAVLNISLDEESFCKYALVEQGNIPENNFDLMNSLNCKNSNLDCFNKSFISNAIGNLKDKMSYTLGIVCKNKAGLFSELKTIYFQTDLGQGNKISIIYPEELNSITTIKISIKTNSPTKNCTYGLNNAPIISTFSSISKDQIYHNTSITLKEGKHNLKVLCSFNSSSITEQFSKNKTFIIDSSKPIKGTIYSASNTSSLTMLTARAFNFTDNESKIKLYEYAIGTAPSGKNGWNSILNWTQTEKESFNAQNLNLTKDVVYYWSVRALNYVNLYSDVSSSLGTKAGVITFYPNNISTCNDKLKNNGETGVDCGKVCDKACAVGTLCYTDDDCNSEDLICGDKLVCILKEGIIDLGDPKEEETIYLFEEELSVSIDNSETNVSIDKKSKAWIYWLLSIFMLIGVAGGGYYVYASKNKKEDVVIPETPVNLDAPLKSEEEIRQEEEIEKKKEELKRALKKKLVENQKKSGQTNREHLFNEFSTTPDENTKSTLGTNNSNLNATHKEKDNLHLDKLKTSLSDSALIDINFNENPTGDDITKENIKNLHKDILNRNITVKKGRAKRSQDKSLKVRHAIKEKFK